MYRTLIALIALSACAPPADDTNEEQESGCTGSALVTLDDLPDPLTEGTTWDEDGVTLTLLASPTGQFNAGPDPDTGCLWLFLGSVLRAEPSCDAAYAEVDVIDYTGPGATAASALEGDDEVAYDENVEVSNPETLYLTGDAMFATLEVDAMESRICELRIDL